MQDPEQTRELLRQLRRRGIKVAIDDFGTGYSSLSYLKRLPIDTLKIDRSFVADVTDEADGAAIVSATIGLAQALGLNIVAEGVETEAQKQTLVGKGCGIMQGYLFSKPLTPIQLTRFLAAMPHASEAG
jgi:EAL domain-containing protein (putative c-di-GMP-specific phosphodiesterase class I)